MRLALQLPWWALLLLALSAAALAWLSYSGRVMALPPRRRAVLIGLRTATLLVLIGCLLRPVRVAPPDSARDAIVPVLVDVSRSMAIADADRQARIAAAAAIVEHDLLPSLGASVTPEVWTFGDTLQRLDMPPGSAVDGLLSAAARRSDLSGALREIHERYRGRRIAGIVVVSDGGDTGTRDASATVDDASVPIYTIGVGAASGARDVEVLELTAGEAGVVEASVDLAATLVSRGSTAAFDVRLLENGRPIDVRRVTPSGDGSPVREVFTVAPSGGAPTLYTIEIPSPADEPVVENNRRTVAVAPPGRRRRLLMIEGAPGFEHAFLKRALLADPGLELDSVVRKGRDASGKPTFFIQAAAERAPLVASGFPRDRPSLFAYDAVILANVEPDAMTSVQLEEVAAFVGVRGGGLLVLGARSFVPQGFAGTALDEVLPVSLAAREADVRRASGGANDARVGLTPDGAAHPVMRIAATPGETLKRWQVVPPLAGASAVGRPRPGAQVLAVVRAGVERPLVAVQRYGHGRAMVFTGEGAWRWRMQLPSKDRTYELFWRHAARWLASASPGRLTIVAPDALVPGDAAAVSVEVRTDAFAPVTGAAVVIRAASPSGRTTELRPALVDPGSGRYGAEMTFDEPGLYRISAEGRLGTTSLATAERWLLVGAADREMTEPRLNEQVLQRLSHATGGRYLTTDEVATLPSLLRSSAPELAEPQVLDVWHNVWIFVLLVAMLTAEWILRRSYGLR